MHVYVRVCARVCLYACLLCAYARECVRYRPVIARIRAQTCVFARCELRVLVLVHARVRACARAFVCEVHTHLTLLLNGAVKTLVACMPALPIA